GGMLFPAMTLTLLPRLARYDLDFDLPDYILPEAIAALYLTTRPDLGDDVTRGPVPRHPARSGRRRQGPPRDDRRLRRAVQRHPQPETTGWAAAPGHAISAAAVQRHRGPPHRSARRHARRNLFRLPRQRPRQRRGPPG